MSESFWTSPSPFGAFSSNGNVYSNMGLDSSGNSPFPSNFNWDGNEKKVTFSDEGDPRKELANREKWSL